MKNRKFIPTLLVALLVLLAIMAVASTGAAKNSADLQITWSAIGGIYV